MNSAEQLQKRIREGAEEHRQGFIVGSVFLRDALKDSYQGGADSLAPLLLEMAEALEKSGTTHLECDDGWYSCPLAENYSIESNQGMPGVCNCGAQIRIEALASFQRFLAKGGE